MKSGKIDPEEANSCAQELWGELIGIDDTTDRERTFTIYKRKTTGLAGHAIRDNMNISDGAVSRK